MTDEPRSDAPPEAAQRWIYHVDGEFAPDEDIPGESIVGAWPVGGDGRVCGPYVANPHHTSGAHGPPPAADWMRA